MRPVSTTADSPAPRLLFAALTVAYVLSQFYRAFLAVLAPVLDTDIGASAEDLAFASGIWLAAFAGLQLPIGYALDYLGPRRTAGGLRRSPQCDRRQHPLLRPQPVRKFRCCRWRLRRPGGVGVALPHRQPSGERRPFTLKPARRIPSE